MAGEIVTLVMTCIRIILYGHLSLISLIKIEPDQLQNLFIQNKKDYFPIAFHYIS